MDILQVYLISPIWWRVSQEDPKTISLKTFDGLELLNPLLYSNLSKQHLGERRDHNIYIKDDNYYLKTNILLLGAEKIYENYDVENLTLTWLPHYLSNLRFCSKQISLRGRSLSFLDFDIDSIPEINYPKQSDKEGVIRKHILESSVTFSHLERADQIGLEKNPEVFHSLLLDAIEATFDEDFRKSLLYCAMAIETLATTKLEKRYETLISEESDSSNFRIIHFEIGGGKEQIKDPIFKLIQDNSSFSNLLHEQPLYLLNKSLLIDDESLYQDSIKLYRTRNKIAHLGEPPEDDKYFGYSENDTRSAIQTCIKVFAWFGENEDYVLPFDVSFEKFYLGKEEDKD